MPVSQKFNATDTLACGNGHIQVPQKQGGWMTGDPQLIYSLEIKVLDLEKKVEALEKALEKLVAGAAMAGEASLPNSVLDEIERGENPVRVIRQFRLMTQKELGERCGIRPNHISAMERGMPFGLKTAKRLAEALDVPIRLLT